MLAHKQFGLPLPINTINPFRITLRSLLEGGITAPEGCLEFLREEYYKKWIESVEVWLEDQGVYGNVILDNKEYPKYLFKCFEGKEYIKNIRTSSFDAYYRKLTLEYIVSLLQKRSPDPLLYQFIDLLREQLEEKEFNRLVEQYSVLCLDCRKK